MLKRKHSQISGDDTCSKFSSSGRDEFINVLAGEKRNRRAHMVTQLRNFADRSPSIIGDFLLFDGHLITEINPFTARARVYDETRRSEAPFVGRVTHGERHAMQLTAPRLLTGKYDDRPTTNASIGREVC